MEVSVGASTANDLDFIELQTACAHRELTERDATGTPSLISPLYRVARKGIGLVAGTQLGKVFWISFLIFRHYFCADYFSLQG